jgi:hypothetical protein
MLVEWSDKYPYILLRIISLQANEAQDSDYRCLRVVMLRPGQATKPKFFKER